MPYVRDSAVAGDTSFHIPTHVHTTIFARWLQALTGDRLTPKHALELLHRFFNTPSPRRECIVLLVDELDQLTAKNNIIYELLNWPLSPHARLVVLTIANTMDLPERMMSHKVSRCVCVCWGGGLRALLGGSLSGLPCMRQWFFSRASVPSSWKNERVSSRFSLVVTRVPKDR